jgi:hypothetical protein
MALTQVSAALLSSEANAQGFRNRIINGDMRIDQRNAGAAVTVNTAGAFYPVDRFRFSGVSSSGVFTAQQIADAPAGFTNSVRVTVTTIDSSLSGSDLYYAAQFIEGFNTADLAWGSASAATVTLSFWAKSSVTGTFGGALSNNGVNRSYPFTYTINAANTWEQKTVTIAGDTAGTWATDNNTGIRVYWGLGVASGFAGTAGAWAASQLLSATGATNLMATNAATWQITGVQLETGTVAEQFERLDYGRQLIQCQRYYYRITPSASSQIISVTAWATTATAGNANGVFPVTMRSAPTALEQSGTASDYLVLTGGASRASSSVPTHNDASTSMWQVNLTVASGQTAGLAGFLRAANTNAYLGWSAEL